MIARLVLALACACATAGAATHVRAAEPARAIHGMSDAFSVPGLAMAWGVLRGASEAATVVVVRVIADPAEFGSIAAAGIDPFTQRATALLFKTPVAGTIDVRVPRAHFADYPRTELRFYGSPSPAGESESPKLVVFYLGVPDTAPEFPSEAALGAYFADRLAHVRNNPGSIPP